MGIYYNGKSWAHNIKLLSDDGKIKYSKRAGFQTFEEALHRGTASASDRADNGRGQNI